MTHSVNIHDAKTQLSKLVDRAAAGEEVVMKSSSPIEPARLLTVDAILKGYSELVTVL